MNDDIKNLKNLLTEGKLDEARALITSSFSKPLTEEERSEAILDLSLIYMEAMNSVNREEKEVLETALRAIGQINKEEVKARDQIKLDDVKASLKIY